VWRLLDLLDEVGLKASMSTNGLAAERHDGIWYARKRDIAAWALEREGKAATGMRPSAAISGV
jgi:hypothetical protein